MTNAPFARARSIDEAVAGSSGAEAPSVEAEQALGFFARCGPQARIASDHEGTHGCAQARLDGFVDFIQRKFVAKRKLASNGGFAAARDSDQDDEAHARMPICEAGAASSCGSTETVPGFAMPSRRTKRRIPRRTFLSESMM